MKTLTLTILGAAMLFAQDDSRYGPAPFPGDDRTPSDPGGTQYWTNCLPQLVPIPRRELRVGDACGCDPWGTVKYYRVETTRDSQSRPTASEITCLSDREKQYAMNYRAAQRNDLQYQNWQNQFYGNQLRQPAPQQLEPGAHQPGLNPQPLTLNSRVIDHRRQAWQQNQPHKFAK